MQLDASLLLDSLRSTMLDLREILLAHSQEGYPPDSKGCGGVRIVSETWTASDQPSEITTATIDYRELIIQRALKKIDDWLGLHYQPLRGGRKTHKERRESGEDYYCEDFGCDSLEELREILVGKCPTDRERRESQILRDAEE